MPNHSKPHLAVLVFYYPNGKSIHAVRIDTLWINLQTEKIVRVETGILDMRPRYEARPRPHE